MPSNSDDFKTRNIDGGVEITSYTGISKNIVIPSEINGQPVLSIGQSAFINMSLISVTIPSGVRTIGWFAFSNNRLSSIKIPPGVITIGQGAFSSNRLTDVVIPSSVMNLEASTFANNLLKSVKISSGITTIGDSAFRNNQLNSVEIPSSVTKIGPYAFTYNQLTDVEIPSSVTTIGREAFSNNQLTNVKISSGVTTLEESAFENNQLISVEIPSSVVKIGRAAFENNRLTSVKISPGVTTIEMRAFSNNQLKSVEIPPSVTKIEWGAFRNNQLTGVQIPASVKSIGASAFYNNKLGFVTFHGEPNFRWYNETPFDGQYKEGKTFYGWYEGKGCADEWNKSVLQPMTIYAKWDNCNYTVTFESNGGSKVPTIKDVLAGKLLPAPSTPVKEGYELVGWYKDADFTTAWDFDRDEVTKDLTLYAKWTKSRYIVTFDSNGGSDVSAQEVVAGELLEAPPMPVKEGYEFAGWYKDAEFTTTWNFEHDVVTEPFTLYAKWTKARYIVTFDSNGGNVVLPQTVEYQELVEAPNPPVKEGYEFASWYKDAEFTTAWDFNHDVVTESLTLYAKWRKDTPTEPSHIVTFDSNGGSKVPSEEVKEGELLKAPTPPVKESYTFAGWYKDADLATTWDFDHDVVTESLMLYAKWTKNDNPEPSYIVTFDSNGGSSVLDKEVIAGKLLQAPSMPVKKGYEFAGWYKDADLTTTWDFDHDVVTEDLMLYAKWTKNDNPEPSYIVTFYSNGGSKVPSEEVKEGELLKAPTPPVKEGYTFAGWYKDAEFATTWDFEHDVVTEPLKLYAKWTKNDNPEISYTVTFDSNGGSKVPSEEVKEGELLKASTLPIKANYTFAGWYKDTKFTTAWDFAKDVVTKNMTLYAKWTKDSTSGGGSGGSGGSGGGSLSYNVTFDSNGGSKISSQTVTYRELVQPPSTPTKEGYTFAGWYKDSELTKAWDFEKDEVTSDTTLYAKWTKESSGCPNTFKDINNNWAKEMIEQIAYRCIIKGYPDGTFRPNNMIQRQHVVLMVDRTLQLVPIREAESFKDVPKGHPYYEQITRLQRAGIIDGSNGAFRPNSFITRAEIAKILVLAFDLTPGGNNTFKDVNPSYWASGYIASLADHNIALGDGNGNFRSSEKLTRAQLTAFMYRALGL